jgi:hypothetical protein
MNVQGEMNVRQFVVVLLSKAGQVKRKRLSSRPKVSKNAFWRQNNPFSCTTSAAGTLPVAVKRTIEHFFSTEIKKRGRHTA